MFVLDRPRVTDNWRVQLPLYQRGHLSLYPGTTVYLAPVRRSDSPPRAFPELLGTTVHKDSWRTVYQVSIDLYDAAGVLHSVLASVAQHGGNVLHLDSISSDQERLHRVEMLVDFAGLRGGQPDLSEEIEGLLLADCSSHIVEDLSSGFSVRARAHRAFRELHENVSLIHPAGPEPPVQEVLVEDKGWFAIPDPLRVLIETLNPGLDLSAPEMTYFAHSDTRERVFRLTLVPQGERILWCAIRHNDQKGAISAITDQLRQHGITLLTALNRVQKHKGTNWFEAILSKDEWRGPDARQERERQEEEVRRLIEVDELGRFNPKVFFDPHERSRAMREGPADEASPGYWILEREAPPLQWITAREKDLSALRDEIDQRARQPRYTDGQETDSDIGARHRRKRSLQKGIHQVRHARGIIKPTVFLSLEYSIINAERIAQAERICRRVDIRLDVVRRSEEERVIHQEVLARLRKATHFIGLWTPTEHDRDNKQPTPWCLWELGAASALSLPTAILVEKGMDVSAYIAIHRGEYYVRFGGDALESDFEQAFREGLRLAGIRSDQDSW